MCHHAPLSTMQRKTGTHNISKRPFCLKNGFLFKDETFLGYDESISSIVDKHGWQIFCLHLEDVLTKVVCEFYAHITSPNNVFIYVPGASVLFDEYSINSQYDLSDVQDEHTQFTATITADCLNQVLQDLCVTGSKWTVSRQDCYTVERASLKPNCRV